MDATEFINQYWTALIHQGHEPIDIFEDADEKGVLIVDAMMRLPVPCKFISFGFSLPSDILKKEI